MSDAGASHLHISCLHVKWTVGQAHHSDMMLMPLLMMVTRSQCPFLQFMLQRAAETDVAKGHCPASLGQFGQESPASKGSSPSTFGETSSTGMAANLCQCSVKSAAHVKALAALFIVAEHNTLKSTCAPSQPSNAVMSSLKFWRGAACGERHVFECQSNDLYHSPKPAIDGDTASLGSCTLLRALSCVIEVACRCSRSLQGAGVHRSW